MLDYLNINYRPRSCVTSYAVETIERGLKTPFPRIHKRKYPTERRKAPNGISARLLHSASILRVQDSPFNPGSIQHAVAAHVPLSADPPLPLKSLDRILHNIGNIRIPDNSPHDVLGVSTESASAAVSEGCKPAPSRADREPAIILSEPVDQALAVGNEGRTSTALIVEGAVSALIAWFILGVEAGIRLDVDGRPVFPSLPLRERTAVLDGPLFARWSREGLGNHARILLGDGSGEGA